MTRGVRIRLIAFVVLSAVGVTYVAANYLGIVDRITGRNISVTVSLPASGGLFEGSSVTYRGVKIGRVVEMIAREDGVDVELQLEDGTELPTDSAVFVHNLSAVGEQYLDFEPPDDDGPYAEDGTHFSADASALPVDEGDLLVDIDRFVGSVDHENLKIAVSELGQLFGDTGDDLQALLDNGAVFIEEASEHTPETIALLNNSLTVLRTQRGQTENIRAFARDLNIVTSMLAGSDRELRQVLDSTPGAATEIRKLLESLEPTLPIFLSDMTTVGQVMVTHLDGIEQLLVTYPTLIAGGPTGSTIDGWGHINVQMDYSVPPCTEGYRPRSEWRSPHITTDAPIYPASCKSPAPYVMRGPKYVPSRRGTAASPPRVYSGSYDPVSGYTPDLVDAFGNPVYLRQPGDLTALGGDAWKWMLVGPLTNQ